MNFRIPFTRYKFPVADMLAKWTGFISAFSDVLKFEVVSMRQWHD